MDFVKMRLFLLLSMLSIQFFGCADKMDEDDFSDINQVLEDEEEDNAENEFSYLALGDSYTVGQGVATDKTWPRQLSARLVEDGVSLSVEIVARTGWTTGDLLGALNNNQNTLGRYDLVSLLIGVNNQYQGRSINEFKTEFEQLLKLAIGLAGNDPDKVFVLSIPDYGVTPFGQSGNPDEVSAELKEFNQLKKEIVGAYGVNYFNVTDISQKASSDLTLLADDQLHPSAIMYEMWVGRIKSSIVSILIN